MKGDKCGKIISVDFYFMYKFINMYIVILMYVFIYISIGIYVWKKCLR